MNELQDLIRRLGKDAKELSTRPAERNADKSGDIQDSQMLEGFQYLLITARDHRIDVHSDTLAVIDWVRMLTMRGELGQLVSETT